MKQSIQKQTKQLVVPFKFASATGHVSLLLWFTVLIKFSFTIWNTFQKLWQNQCRKINWLLWLNYQNMWCSLSLSKVH